MHPAQIEYSKQTRWKHSAFLTTANYLASSPLEQWLMLGPFLWIIVSKVHLIYMWKGKASLR